MVAVSDFSGLMSWAWAFANAEASAATVSLDRGMGHLRLQHIKAHRPRARALGPQPMPDGLLGILGIKALSSLFARSWSRKALRVLRKSAANSAQEFDEFISTIRMASMCGRGGSALIRWGVSPDCTQRQNFFSAETRTLK